MIEPTGRVDKALGIDLKKIYKTISNVSVKSASCDQINISQFSSLVEKTRNQILEMPSIRADKVAQVKADLATGEISSADDVASAMINYPNETKECKE